MCNEAKPDPTVGQVYNDLGSSAQIDATEENLIRVRKYVTGELDELVKRVGSSKKKEKAEARVKTLTEELSKLDKLADAFVKAKQQPAEPAIKPISVEDYITQVGNVVAQRVYSEAQRTGRWPAKIMIGLNHIAPPPVPLNSSAKVVAPGNPGEAFDKMTADLDAGVDPEVVVENLRKSMEEFADQLPGGENDEDEEVDDCDCPLCTIRRSLEEKYNLKGQVKEPADERAAAELYSLKRVLSVLGDVRDGRPNKSNTVREMLRRAGLNVE